MTYTSRSSTQARLNPRVNVVSVRLQITLPQSATLNLRARAVAPPLGGAWVAAGGGGRGGAKSAITIRQETVTGGEIVSDAISASDVVQTIPNRPVGTPAAKLPSPEALGRQFKPALNVGYWSNNLPHIYSSARCRSVLSQLTTGVRVGRSAATSAIISHNWPSAITYRDQVSKIIREDLAAGRLHGPFIHPPYQHFIISPLGAFPKRNSTKIRLIHDLSFPVEGSVNSLIDPDDCRLSYSSVDDAVAICRSMAPDPPFMAKLDLENAFKHVFVHPEDWHLLGFSWPNSAGQTRYYFSKVLNFGLRSSPYLFDIFAQALAEFMSRGGVPGQIVRYVDDFLVVAKSAPECQASLNIMLQVCADAGFSVQPSKVTSPSTTTEFLGILIDTVNQELRISQQRLQEIAGEVGLWLDRKKITKRQLLSLVGKFSFAARVVRSGKAFISRLLHLAKAAKGLHHYVKLTQEAKADLKWWYDCISTHNGVSYFAPSWAHNVTHIFTDASGRGMGAKYENQWFGLSYVSTLAPLVNRSINYREFHVAVTALATWAKELEGKSVVFHIDNTVVCSILNSLYSPVQDLMFFTRAWCLLIERFSITAAVVYINTDVNVDADDLSRLKFNEFHARNPSANSYMTWPCMDFMACSN